MLQEQLNGHAKVSFEAEIATAPRSHMHSRSEIDRVALVAESAPA